MSGINGDKARFHRRRKKKIARRQSQQQLFKNLTEAGRSAPPAASAKTKTVQA